MTNTAQLFTGLAVVKRFAFYWPSLFVLLATLISSSAQAITAGQTWVASTGNDVNDCSNQATPCRSLAGAYAQTSPGGEIICVGSNTFFSASTFTITHSITIDCQGVSEVLLADGTDFITVNAGPADAVILRGLDFESFMLGGFTPGLAGISFTGGGTLHVQNCTFRNFTHSGIKFAPSGAAKLFVSNSVFQHNGGTSTGGGIIIQPGAAGSAEVELDRVQVENNVFGIAADGTGSSAGINMTIADSMTAGNSQDGIIAVTPSGGAPIGVMVTNTKSVNNTFGIRSIGPNVTVRVKNSDITGNSTGLSFSGGGALLSTGNNLVEANGTNGAFSGPVALQ
jgi:hypothetical protein